MKLFSFKPQAPLVTRLNSLIVIALCGFAGGFELFVVIDLKSSPYHLAWSIVFCIQCACQFQGIHLGKRRFALIASMIPILIGSLMFFMLQIGFAGYAFFTAYLNWRWYRVLEQDSLVTLTDKRARPIATPSQSKFSSSNGMRKIRFRWNWALFSASLIVLVVSFFVTPNSSGVPASFGNVVQPLAWIFAAGITALAGVVLLAATFEKVVAKANSYSSMSTGFVRLCQILSLILNIAQLCFTKFGPNI